MNMHACRSVYIYPLVILMNLSIMYIMCLYPLVFPIKVTEVNGIFPVHPFSFFLANIIWIKRFHFMLV